MSFEYIVKSKIDGHIMDECSGTDIDRTVHLYSGIKDIAGKKIYEADRLRLVGRDIPDDENEFTTFFRNGIFWLHPVKLRENRAGFFKCPYMMPGDTFEDFIKDGGRWSSQILIYNFQNLEKI